MDVYSMITTLAMFLGGDSILHVHVTFGGGSGTPAGEKVLCASVILLFK